MLRSGRGVLLMAAVAATSAGCGLSPQDVEGGYELLSAERLLAYTAGGGEDRELVANTGAIRQVVAASRYDIIYTDGILLLGTEVPEIGCDLSAYVSGNSAFLATGAQCSELYADGREVGMLVFNSELLFSQDLLQVAAEGNFLETLPDGTRRDGYFATVLNLRRAQ